MFKAIVRMLDGTEKHTEVIPIERDGCKFAPPLVLNPDKYGLSLYVGKGVNEPAVYVQQSL